MFWQADAETSLFKQLSVEGIITNKIEQIKSIQPEALLNLINSEILIQFNTASSNVTNFIAFAHTNGTLAFSNNSIILNYNQVSSKLSSIKGENFTTNEGGNIFIISLANNETLPMDFLINLESILQKHGANDDDLLKRSLDGLFEMLELSSPTLQPIHFVTFKP